MKERVKCENSKIERKRLLNSPPAQGIAGPVETSARGQFLVDEPYFNKGAYYAH